MPVPTSGRVLWTGTAASIPTNWSRDANFDDRFLQGDDSGFTGSATTVAANHFHQIPAHTHTANTHVHRFSAGSTMSQSNNAQTSAKPTPRYCVTWSHSHSSKNSSSRAVTYQNSSAVNTNSTAAYPSYYTAIVIEPDDALQDIPDDAVCFTDESTAPTGFTICDGSGGTPNLDDRFILGAATGNDGGGTGGSATHTHTSSSSHTHNANSHTHSATTCGSATTTSAFSKISSPAPTSPVYAHHNVTLTSATSNNADSATPTTDAGSSEPAYTRLLGIQNTSGGSTLPDNVVILWTASAASIPAGWSLMDGTGSTTNCIDKQIKVTTSSGEIGDTGGSDTHTHDVTHTHTVTGSHTHGSSVTNISTTFEVRSGITIIAKNSTHTHTWTVNNNLGDPDLNSAAPTTDSKDGRYSYRTVVFIKKISITEVVKDIILSRGLIPFSR